MGELLTTGPCAVHFKLKNTLLCVLFFLLFGENRLKNFRRDVATSKPAFDLICKKDCCVTLFLNELREFKIIRPIRSLLLLARKHWNNTETLKYTPEKIYAT